MPFSRRTCPATPLSLLCPSYTQPPHTLPPTPSQVELSGPLSRTSVTATASFEVRSPKRLQLRLQSGTVATPEILSDLSDLPTSISLLGGPSVDLTQVLAYVHACRGSAMNLSGWVICWVELGRRLQAGRPAYAPMPKCDCCPCNGIGHMVRVACCVFSSEQRCAVSADGLSAARLQLAAALEPLKGQASSALAALNSLVSQGPELKVSLQPQPHVMLCHVMRVGMDGCMQRLGNECVYVRPKGCVPRNP
jgi:hypothetical protein